MVRIRIILGRLLILKAWKTVVTVCNNHSKKKNNALLLVAKIFTYFTFGLIYFHNISQQERLYVLKTTLIVYRSYAYGMIIGIGLGGLMYIILCIYGGNLNNSRYNKQQLNYEKLLNNFFLYFCNTFVLFQIQMPISFIFQIIIYNHYRSKFGFNNCQINGYIYTILGFFLGLVITENFPFIPLFPAE